MTFLEAIKAAGHYGVVARKSWDPNSVVLIGKAEKAGGKLKAELFELNGNNSFGNYDPPASDMSANDWDVVAKSSRRLSSL